MLYVSKSPLCCIKITCQSGFHSWLYKHHDTSLANTLRSLNIIDSRIKKKKNFNHLKFIKFPITVQSNQNSDCSKYINNVISVVKVQLH